jgi:hypothetical protein
MSCGYSTEAAVWFDGEPYPLEERLVGGPRNLIDAEAINDAGQIVATDALGMGTLHAVLLTPRLE